MLLYGILWRNSLILDDVVKAEVSDSAKLLIDIIDRNLFERYHDAQAFVVSLSGMKIRQLDNGEQSKKLSQILNTFVLQYRVYDQILLLDLNGKTIASNTVNIEGLPLSKNRFSHYSNLAEKRWFKKVISQDFLAVEKGVVGTVVAGPARDLLTPVNESSDIYQMVFAAPIYDAAGKVVAIWANFLDFSVVEKIVAESYHSLSEKGYIKSELTILDELGNIIIDFDPSNFGYENYKRDFSILGKLNLAEKGVDAAKLAVSGLSGANLSSHYRKQEFQVSGYAHSRGVYGFPGLHWSVLIRIPLDEAYIESDKLKNLSLIIFGCFLFFMTLSGFIVSRKISQPLRILTKKVGQLSDGELNIEIPKVGSNDEIAEIIQAVIVFRDKLVERKILEQETKIQQKKLEISNRALQASTSGIVVTDPNIEDNPIVYVNKAFLSLTGYSAKEVMGKNCRFLQKTDTDQPEISYIRHCILSEISCDVVLRNYRKDGTAFWNHLRIDPVLDNDGYLTHFIGIQTDVTELRKAQLAAHKANKILELRVHERTKDLAEAEKRMRAVFETAIDGIILIDKNSIILDLNESVTKITGRKREELLGGDFTTLMAEPYQSEHSCYIANFKKNGENHNLSNIREVKGKHKLGYEIPLELSIGDTWINGELFFVGIIRDITEKYQARKQREKLYRELKLATEAGGIGIWSWDIKNNSLEWDDRMYQIYGIEKQSQKPPYDLWKQSLLKEDRKNAEQKLQQAINNLSHFSTEFRIRYGKEGSIRWIKASADPLSDEYGQATGMTGVNIDISEERNAQNALQKETEKANAANEAKSRFLANMSHEIRTPMNGIVGMLDLLRETGLTQDQKRMTRTIRDSSFSLLDIINDILDLSKIEAGQMALEDVPISIMDTVERSVEALWITASQKGVDLYLDFNPEVPELIMGDSIRIRQILFNLISNAIKFSKGLMNKGEVWVTIRHSSMNTESEEILIEVQDNGIGMSKRQTKSLFKPFSQADSSTTRKYGGTGLGLSITKSLVDMMNGSISLKSEKNQGSQFTISLPFKRISSKQQKKTESIDISGCQMFLIMANTKLADSIKKLIAYHRSTLWLASTMREAESLLTSSDVNKESLDVFILDSDVDFEDAKQRLGKTINNETLEKICFVTLTTDLSSTKGKIKPNLVVVGAYPLKPSEFIHGLALALGRKSALQFDQEEILDLNSQTITVPSVADAERNGTLILVAEDHPTNREVIQRQLHYLGYACVIVNNGVEALDQWKKRNYALLLTDCHMPKLDGFELTSEIRSLEQEQSQLTKIPIIAITANALLGEVDHCISAGMDDYLSKPVEVTNLKKILDRWINASKTTHESHESIANDIENLDMEQESFYDDGLTPINFQRLSDILGSKEENLLHSILQLYWETALEDFAKIDQAFNDKELTELRNKVHAAKGAANSSGASLLGKALMELQHETDNGDWAQISVALQDSHEKLKQLEGFLKQRGIIAANE